MSVLELKIPPIIVLAFIGIFMWLAANRAPEWALTIPGHVVIAIVIGLIGILLILAGAIEFRAAKTTVNPMQPGNASSIVTRGVYAISRNPMYVGFLLILLSWAVFLSNILSFAVLPTFVWYMNRFQIIPEERALLAKFDEDYSAYTKSVRRWL